MYSVSLNKSHIWYISFAIVGEYILLFNVWLMFSLSSAKGVCAGAESSCGDGTYCRENRGTPVSSQTCSASCWALPTHTALGLHTVSTQEQGQQWNPHMNREKDFWKGCLFIWSFMENCLLHRSPKRALVKMQWELKIQNPGWSSYQIEESALFVLFTCEA